MTHTSLTFQTQKSIIFIRGNFKNIIQTWSHSKWVRFQVLLILPNILSSYPTGCVKIWIQIMFYRLQVKWFKSLESPKLKSTSLSCQCDKELIRKMTITQIPLSLRLSNLEQTCKINWTCELLIVLWMSHHWSVLNWNTWYSSCGFFYQFRIRIQT